METQTESSPDSSRVEILRAWPDDSICHGFIGRSGGVSTGAFASMNLSYWVGDDERAVDTNWQRLRREVPDLKLVARLNQVHGNVVHAATRDTAALRPPGDGIVTAEPGVMLGIFTADCVPILMVDSKRKIAGALHAGWRGVIADIADAGVRAMVQLGARASDIRAAMGPSIGQCCFEVDAELGDRFSREIDGARESHQGRASRQGLHRLARRRARPARTRGPRAREHRERRPMHSMRLRSFFLAPRRRRKDHRPPDELRRLRRVKICLNANQKSFVRAALIRKIRKPMAPPSKTIEDPTKYKRERELEKLRRERDLNE